MEFKDQYKHPQWQRKRLEALEFHGFICQTCDSTEKQLHVHHKRYIKGRKIWEYGADELEVLCCDCHSEAHGARENIQAIIAACPSFLLPSVSGLLLAWLEDDVEFSEDLAKSVYSQDWWASDVGRLARVFGQNVSLEAIEALSKISPDRIERIADMVKSGDL